METFQCDFLAIQLSLNWHIKLNQANTGTREIGEEETDCELRGAPAVVEGMASVHVSVAFSSLTHLTQI